MIESEEAAVRALGQADARASAETGQFFLMAGKYGVGCVTEVYASAWELQNACVDDLAGLKIFEECTDVFFLPPPGEPYEKLRDQPRRTYLYAWEYNAEMLRLLPPASTPGCSLTGDEISDVLYW
jgi:hypothetical protein